MLWNVNKYLLPCNSQVCQLIYQDSTLCSAGATKSSFPVMRNAASAHSSMRSVVRNPSTHIERYMSTQVSSQSVWLFSWNIYRRDDLDRDLHFPHEE